MKPAEDLTTCKSVPSLISHNVCILLDVRNLASKNDWKSDDMGSWKNNGVQHFRYHVGQDKDVIVENDENRKKAGKMFTMKRSRIYYKIIPRQMLKRLHHSWNVCIVVQAWFKICYLSRTAGHQDGSHFFIEYSHLVFLQYIFNGVEHPVDPSPHGNGKQAHSYGYVRTKKSTAKTNSQYKDGYRCTRVEMCLGIRLAASWFDHILHGSPWYFSSWSRPNV